VTETACAHPPEKLESSFKIWFIGLVTDWRYWAIAVAASVLNGVLAGPVGLGGWANILYAFPGVYLAMMLSRYRRCGACSQRVRFPLMKPPPPLTSKQ